MVKILHVNKNKYEMNLMLNYEILNNDVQS